jgi:RNA polymerase sigma factor (sigma-70 family)
VIDYKDAAIMRQMYNDYVRSYTKLKKYRRKVNKQYENTEDVEEIRYKKALYQVEKDILDALIKMERYFPYSDQYYSNKRDEENRKLTFNKSSNYGHIKEESKIIHFDEIIKNREKQRFFKETLKEFLPHQQYMCVFLHYAIGKTQQDIAEELNISQPNVNAYIKNALEKIKNSNILI